MTTTTTNEDVILKLNLLRKQDLVQSQHRLWKHSGVMTHTS